MTSLSLSTCIIPSAGTSCTENEDAVTQECVLRQQQQRKRMNDRRWMKLVLPWITIAVIACGYAIGNSTENHYVPSQSVSNERYSYFDRRLMTEFNDDDATPPTTTTTTTSSITTYPYTSSTIHIDPTSQTIQYQQQQQQHSHKPVFQEEHKPLVPLDKTDYYGVFFTILGLMVAAGGGIGGGGILVPIYILIMGFSPKHAIPLSNVTVFGGAIANVLLNMSKRHPSADRPLVDWDLILVMEPLTIAGALLGAFLNKLLPELLLTVLLVLLLSSTAYDTLKRAIKMYKKETIALRKQGISASGTKESELTHIATEQQMNGMEEATVKLLDDVEVHESGETKLDTKNDEKNDSDATTKTTPEEKLKDDEVTKLQAELNDILEKERVTPMINIQILMTLFVVVLTINMLKGGGAFKSPLGIVCGSTGFWMANIIMIVWIVLISVFVRQYLLTKYYAKQRTNYQYVEGDIQWDGRASIVYPFICMFAGFFAGMFGVGKYRFFGTTKEKDCVSYHFSNVDQLNRNPLTQSFLRPIVLYRWGYCKGSVDVSYGCSSCCIICVVGMYDIIYKLYSNNVLYRFWLISTGLRCRMFTSWLYSHIGWTNILNISDETIPT
jgi:uncharacterized membrane protein YfcA